MAKTPLLRALRKAFRLAQLSERPNMPPADEIGEWLAQQRQRPGWSRRQFINGAIKAGAAFGVASVLPGCGDNRSAKNPPDAPPVPSGPSIAIVGAGMAGLHAGYLLKKAGLGASVNIYEASNRSGGRMFTQKLFKNQQTTEFGGEFIDSNHTDMLHLAKTFGITVLDKSSDTLTPDAFFMDGKHRSLKDVIRAFNRVRKKIAADAAALGENYDTPAAKKFDQMTLRAYLGSLRTDVWFIKLLDVAYAGEYGLATDEQSAINLLDLIGTEPGGFELFGESDERWKLLGGNQQICDRLADELKDNLRFGHKLLAVKNKGEGFTLSFSGAGGTKSIDADIVVMAVPFTTLREVEGIDGLAGMTPEKLQCIREIGYGTNGKIFLGLHSRPWRTSGYQGYLYTNEVHTGWDNYHLQNGNAGPAAYTVFLGGGAGAGVKPEDAAGFLPVLNKAFPGFEAAYDNTQNAAFNWTVNPLSKGSYACYKPGQWTGISGQEAKPVGNMFFAGEHCSSAFLGFMNGAAETGRVAAEQILLKIKK